MTAAAKVAFPLLCNLSRMVFILFRRAYFRECLIEIIVPSDMVVTIFGGLGLEECLPLHLF